MGLNSTYACVWLLLLNVLSQSFMCIILCPCSCPCSFLIHLFFKWDGPQHGGSASIRVPTPQQASAVLNEIVTHVLILLETALASIGM